MPTSDIGNADLEMCESLILTRHSCLDKANLTKCGEQHSMWFPLKMYHAEVDIYLVVNPNWTAVVCSY